MQCALYDAGRCRS
ncbi:23S rRNA methyltransferase, partial [Salmonella enterica subsp. enterica serovar Typhimurium]